MMTEGKSLTGQVWGRIEELAQWLISLDPSFAFLLALPFLVGFAGLLSEYLRQCRTRSSSGHSANHGSS
jgi:hypothetical protein